jgi:hypothetical protein
MDNLTSVPMQLVRERIRLASQLKGLTNALSALNVKRPSRAAESRLRGPHESPPRNVLAGQGLRGKSRLYLRPQTQDVTSRQKAHRSSSESSLGEVEKTKKRVGWTGCRLEGSASLEFASQLVWSVFTMPGTNGPAEVNNDDLGARQKGHSHVQASSETKKLRFCHFYQSRAGILGTAQLARSRDHSTLKPVSARQPTCPITKKHGKKLLGTQAFRTDESMIFALHSRHGPMPAEHPD